MDQMKIHNVISGPYDNGEDIWNVCLIETNGDLEEAELFYDSYDEAYEMVKHFTKSIQPLIMFIGDESGYEANQ